MIARLRGIVWEKTNGRVVVDVNGVGYDVVISLSTAAALGEPGAVAELYVSTQVREDSMTLFGFVRPEERTIFELLLGVSGVGPKTAIGALSAMTVGDIVTAVTTDDVVRLTRIPGIGKKTAERLLIELRDKIDGLRASPGLAPVGGGVRGDALAALLSLGYSAPHAERALQGLGDASGTVQDLIKAALQKLSGR
jgi:holliday junction DNA helicase RuvA